MGDDGHLVYYSEVRWLFYRGVMEKEWKFQEEFVMWLNRQNDYRTHLVQNLFWLAKLAYLFDIFGMLDILNIIIQECENDIFEATFKITLFKQNVKE